MSSKIKSFLVDRWWTTNWHVAFELQNAAIFAAWGLYLLNPRINTFLSNPNFQKMLYSSESGWGYILLLYGTLQLSAMRWGSIRARIISLYFDQLLWWYWVTEFFISNKTSLFVPTAFILWLCSFLALARMSGWWFDRREAPTDTQLVGQRCPRSYSDILAFKEETGPGDDAQGKRRLSGSPSKNLRLSTDQNK